MGMPELVLAMEQDAQAQAATILEAARAASAELLADADRARAERHAKAAEDCALAARTAADVQLAAAHRAARATTLAARAQMLERVERALVERLPALALELGDSLLRAAIMVAGDRPGTLRCAPELAVRGRVLAPATLRVAAAGDVQTGVRIQLDTGTEIVATLAAIAERERPRFASRALALLAEAGTS